MSLFEFFKVLATELFSKPFQPGTLLLQILNVLASQMICILKFVKC